MLSRPAMLGLLSFCLGAVVCAIGSRLASGRGYVLTMILGGAFILGGLWLAFFGYSFLYGSS
jgi:hypothetical protein